MAMSYVCECYGILVGLVEAMYHIDCMPGSCSVSNQTDHLTLLNESSDIQLKAKQSSGRYRCSINRFICALP